MCVSCCHVEGEKKNPKQENCKSKSYCLELEQSSLQGYWAGFPHVGNIPNGFHFQLRTETC